MTIFATKVIRIKKSLSSFWFQFVPRLSVHYVQGQEPEKGIREYFYFIDHQGMLFLDDARIKNFTSCFKDKRFLIFFFRQVRRNDTGRYMVDFPFVSPCGKERNFIRGDDYPAVYTHLTTKSSFKTMEPEEHLCYGHTGDVLSVRFEPNKIYMAESGRVYHPAPSRFGGIGLISSKLAIELSKFFKFEGTGNTPSHFEWLDTTHTLASEWYKKAQEEHKSYMEKAKAIDGYMKKYFRSGISLDISVFSWTIYARMLIMFSMV